ncbi:MAG TPA: DinB family protein [Terracidiphilus sp.]|nr:DinB family protein [Terracidiphilus sp.]
MGELAVSEFRLLQQQKDLFLNNVATWAPAQLRLCCKPGSWSALQVLDHVIRTERGILAEIQKNVRQCDRVAFVHRVKSDLLILLMRSPARVKVPGLVSRVILPGNEIDLVELIAAWNESQTQLEQWASELRENQTGYAGFRHPVSGWMSVLQAIMFLAAHVRHHRYQLGRIRRHARWPQAGAATTAGSGRPTAQ